MSDLLGSMIDSAHGFAGLCRTRVSICYITMSSAWNEAWGIAYLCEVLWRIHLYTSRCGIELATVEVQKSHKHLAKVLHSIHVPTLQLWHVLHETDYQTRNGESS